MSELDAAGEAMTTKLPCEVHRTHSPHSHINQRHHVWPLGEGGPNVAANIVVVCPTGHANIHDLLARMVAGGGLVPYSVQRWYGRRERELARLGYERIQRQAL